MVEMSHNNYNYTILICVASNRCLCQTIPSIIQIGPMLAFCGVVRKEVKYNTHYETWGSKEREFLMRYCVVEPEPSSCICLACYRDQNQVAVYA